jgi:hypothetical protein
LELPKHSRIRSANGRARSGPNQRALKKVIKKRDECWNCGRGLGIRKPVILSSAQIERAFAVWPQVEPALRVPHSEREYRGHCK